MTNIMSHRIPGRSAGKNKKEKAKIKVSQAEINRERYAQDLCLLAMNVIIV